MQLVAIVLLAVGLSVANVRAEETYYCQTTIDKVTRELVGCGWLGWWCTYKTVIKPYKETYTCDMDWEEWTTCTEQCGNSGIQSRKGDCNHPSCTRDPIIEDRSCNRRGCPVDGGWGPWKETVTKCSTTCDEGTKTKIRTRQCNNPAPQNDGDECKGEKEEREYLQCFIEHCPVDGAWSDWTRWNCDACSVAEWSKSRSCTNPAPAHGGMPCPDEHDHSRVEHRFCEQDCPGEVWSDFDDSRLVCEACSASCGKGTKRCSLTRDCEIEPCTGEATVYKTVSCQQRSCPVDGGWSAWNDDKCGQCSVSCGKGTRTCPRTRLCIDPPPAHGGKECVGSGSEEFEEDCFEEPCPVDGEWTDWKAIGCDSCDAECGEGKKQCHYLRVCNQPINGGKACEGDETREVAKTCIERPCPVDGGWSEFSEAVCGVCSETCGIGSKTCTHQRQCNAPSPAFGGKACQGDFHEEWAEECNLTRCQPAPPHCRLRCDGVADGATVLFPHEENPNMYYKCQGQTEYPITCPIGLFWKDSTDPCERPELVNNDKCEGMVSCMDDEGVIGCYIDECPAGTEQINFGSELEEEAMFPCDESQNLQRRCAGDDCSFHYWCVNGFWQSIECPAGTYFDETLSLCNHLANQNSCHGGELPETNCRNGTSAALGRGNCDTYSLCDNGRIQRMTCAPKTRYDPVKQECTYYHLVECPGHDTYPECEDHGDGFKFEHTECTKYWECEHMQPIERDCANDTPVFDPVQQVCVWPDEGFCFGNK